MHIDACPACGEHGETLHDDVIDRAHGVPGEWSILRCVDCRTLWLDPRPDDLAACYPSTYFTHGDIGGGPTIPDRIPVGRLLDIGCGSGAYLARMRDVGWDVTGVEVDPVAAEVARDRGLKVFAGVEEVPGTFDVVTLNHVIEHVPEPLQLLCDALERTGDTLLLRTPNAASLGHRLFKTRWYHLDPPRHLFVLTPKGLQRLVSRLPVDVSMSTSNRSAGKAVRRALGKSTWPVRIAAKGFAAVERFGSGEELDAELRR